MKPTKLIYTFVFTFILLTSFVFLFTANVQAQEAKQTKNKVETEEKSSTVQPNNPQAITDKIEFKNETTNSILTITDEGSNAGSILIPQGSALADPNDDDKLYNVSGNLHWNGSQLGTNSSSAGWTDTGAKIHTTTSSNKVGIGTTNPNSLLSVGGDGSGTATISCVNNGINQQGIFAKSTGYSSYGVFGKATGDESYGIYGEATADGSIGVSGSATATGAVPNWGGQFHASGDLGVGVSGSATATGSVQNYGGYFRASGNSGRGVYGEATGSTGYGIYGKATTGRGVYGQATTGYGVFGSANGIGGNGVITEAHGEDGRAIAAYASGLNGWAGWFSGRVYVSGTFSNPSDKRFKKNITPLKSVLKSLDKIEGYTYNWKVEDYPERKFNNDKLQVGVIAQDLEKVYPNLVTTDRDGYKSVDYIKLSVITMQAVKELNEKLKNQELSVEYQDKRLKELEKQNLEYRNENASLENRLSKIESLFNEKKFTSVSK
ncbi:MAG: tail fiber domain-containing protein [Melioribacteraceae bacterium]